MKYKVRLRKLSRDGETHTDITYLLNVLRQELMGVSMGTFTIFPDKSVALTDTQMNKLAARGFEFEVVGGVDD